jgi:hypothetical protein
MTKLDGDTAKLTTASLAFCAGDPLSVTLTVNELVPAAVGEPVVAPVDEFRLRPAGSAPELIE